MSFIGQTINTISETGLILTDVPCAPDVIVGDWVRMDAGEAKKALADSFDHSNVIGIVEAITGTFICTIRVLGRSSVTFVGLDETKEYYLSDAVAGTMDTVVPTVSGHVILKVGQPVTATSFLVLKGIRMVRS